MSTRSRRDRAPSSPRGSLDATRPGSPSGLAPESRRGNLAARLALLAAIAPFVLLTAASFQRIGEADIWWQYRTGRHVLEEGIPRTDPFSFTASGRPWIELRWLFCATLYLVVQAAGFSGAVVLKWIVLIAAFGLIASLSWSRPPPVGASLALMLGVLASSQRFLVRPELVSILFLAVLVWVIERHRATGTRLLFAVPLLQVVWVNAHTLFLLGPIVVGLYLASAVLQRLREARGADMAPGAVRAIAAVFAGSIAACFLNPYLARGVVFPFTLLAEIHGTAFKEGISEFRGPFAYGLAHPSVIAYIALIALVAASALANARRLDPFWTLLVVSQVYLSLTAIRNIPLFALVAVPFVARNLREASWIPSALARVGRPLRPAAAAAILAVCTVYSWSFATSRLESARQAGAEPGLGLVEHRYPEEATRFLKEKLPPGRTFNTMFEGSYLLAHGVEVFIDPRLEVYGERFFESYAAALEDRTAWEETVRSWNIERALIGINSALAQRLLSSPGWALVHFDEVAAIFVREGLVGAPPPIRDRAAFDAAIARIRARLPGPRPTATLSPIRRTDASLPYRRLAAFLRAAGQGDAAAQFAQDALRADPRDTTAHLVLASAYEERRDFPRAVVELRAALPYAPADSIVRRQLGIGLLEMGKREEARAELERYVGDAAADPLAWALLSKIHAEDGRAREALACAEKAAAIDPADPELRKNLGRIAYRAGDRPRAIRVLEEAAHLDPRDSSLCRDLAVILLELGRRGDAARWISRGLALEPENAELLTLQRQVGAAPAGGSS